MFRQDKATAAATYFLELAEGNRLNDLLMMKLLYNAERESLRRFTAPITGSTFFSMKNGPVLSEVIRLFKGEVHGEVWHAHIKFLRYPKDNVPENTLEIIRPFNSHTVLSAAEVQILQHVWDEAQALIRKLLPKQPKWTMVELVHDYPEWDPRAKQLSTSFPLKVETIFAKGFSDPKKLAEEKARDVEYYQTLTTHARSRKRASRLQD